MVASALLLGACTTTQATPATAPETSQPATTTIAVSPATTTTTTASAPTTTADRTSEIEAIFQDLEQRRLTALYEGDREAFAALFANDAYLQRDRESFDFIEFISEPSSIVVRVEEVFADEPSCIAVNLYTDFRSTLGSESVGNGDVVLERADSGWGYSWAGEGWRCDGSHPLRS
jgi:hypothetical protein